MTKYAKETAVGFFVFIGLLCIAYMSIQLGNLKIFSKEYYMVTAKFGDITGLKVNAPVQMLGVDIGFVEKIALDPENDVAVVQFLVKRQFKLYDDSIASVKTSGLIGDKYLKIAPGGAGDEIPPGGTLMKTESSIDLESIISKYVFGKV